MVVKNSEGSGLQPLIVIQSGRTATQTIQFQNTTLDLYEMIPRTAEPTIRQLAQGFPVIAITGPRQAGKTTLSRICFPDKPYISLEDLDERSFANDDPRGFLARFPNGAILDEVQHCPPLFSYLQTRVDNRKQMGDMVLTGSSNFSLLSQIGQSLAGRVGILHLLPFSSGELLAANRPIGSVDEMLFRGLYPPLFDRDLNPQQWLNNYLATYLERDVRQLTNIRDLSLFQRFIKMCAARTGQLLNLASLATDCGVSAVTIRAWLSILEASYIIFLLNPYHQNFGKRLVKSPKLYFIDTGLAAALLGIQSAEHLSIHPARPALFETWVIASYLKNRFNQGLPSNLYFWRDHMGNEVDLILEQGEKLIAVEIKSGQTIADDFFAGLRKWQLLAKEVSEEPTLIYGGEASYRRSGSQILGWLDFAKSK